MSAPANDNFANAIVLSGNSGNTTGSNVSATVESGEPGHANYNPGPVAPIARATIGPYATVWYKWTCGLTQDYYFSTRDTSGGNATTIPTTIQVFTGSSVNALSAVTYILNQSVGDGNGMDLGASVAFAATSGTTYYIQVDSRYQATLTGGFKLLWDAFVMPRLGSCDSCGPDFQNEICLGTMAITDVTTDAIYSFGTFSLDPGNFKVRYCGGTYYINPHASNAGGWVSNCGEIFTGASVAAWNPSTTWTSGQIVFVTMGAANFDANYTSVSGIWIATGTNSAVAITDESTSFGTVNCGAQYCGQFTWTMNTWANWTQPQSSCCTGGPTPPVVDYSYDAAQYISRDSTFGQIVPGLSIPPWTASTGQTGGNWSSIGTQLGSLTLYSTAATAESAAACTDTGWFMNRAGEIGSAFNANWASNYPAASGCTCNAALGVNQSKNPTIQLLWQPFTPAMLNSSQGATNLTNSSGTVWNIQFKITNISNINWDNCSVEVLLSGGVTAASAPQIFGLTSSATTTSPVFQITADPSTQLITATIQISRNGVVVTTLSYPLYPILTIVASAVTPTTWCSGHQKEVVVQWNNINPTNLTAFGFGSFSGNESCLSYDIYLDSGSTIPFYGAPSACTSLGYTLTANVNSSPGSANVATYVLSAVTGSHNMVVEFYFNVGTAQIALPTTTLPISY